MRKVFLLSAFLLASLALAQNQVNIQPDCFIPFTLTAAGNFPAATANNGPGDNRQKGCAAWTLMYQNTGMTAVTVTLQSGSSTSTTVTFGGFAGTISMGFANPIVSDTGGSLQAVNGTADISWVRVNVAATGTGTLTGVLYGFRNSSAAVNGGGGGALPSGSAFNVECYKDATHFEACGTSGEATILQGGSSDPGGIVLGVSGTTTTPSSGDTYVYLQEIITAPADVTALYGLFQEMDLAGTHNYGSPRNLAGGLFINSTGTVGQHGSALIPGTAVQGDTAVNAALTGGFLSGVFGDVQLNGMPTVNIAAAFWGWIGNYSGTSTLLTDFYGQVPDGGGSAATFVTYYGEAIGGSATDSYDFWADEAGVFRIKADNTFNSVYQAIPALYNPQFTKYTPGATNFERCIPGCQWESNEAWIRTEEGGTGTLRRLGLGSAGLDNSTGNVANPFTNVKTSVSATAPGAGKADLRWLAGTNMGTCKLVANAGTSATEVTIIDNVGNGC